jgi:two-component system cell cycle response regulator
LRVLVAEDDAVSRTLLEARLRLWSYEVLLAKDGLEAWDALQRPEAPRLAILDWMMPGMDGLDVCRRLRARPGEPYTYVLLLTAKDAKEDLIEGLQAGADEYLTKPFNAQELDARLRAGRRIVELQSELIAAREALREQATTDSLTRLLNRAAILEAMRRDLIRSRREHGCLTVSMADIDHFKDVNDRFGHAAGDAVLVEVSRRMLSVMRPYDTIGRYGGEEFVIVVPGCADAASIGLVERVRQRVAQDPIPFVGGSVSVTMSFGVCATRSDQPAELDSILRTADAALYEAKKAGRNCIRSCKL